MALGYPQPDHMLEGGLSASGPWLLQVTETVDKGGLLKDTLIYLRN